MFDANRLDNALDGKWQIVLKATRELLKLEDSMGSPQAYIQAQVDRDNAADDLAGALSVNVDEILDAADDIAEREREETIIDEAFTGDESMIMDGGLTLGEVKALAKKNI